MSRYFVQSLLVSTFLVAAHAAFAAPAASVPTSPDGIGGVVTSSKGPEAGVWVIAETRDTPTHMLKIVVTDDQGRFYVPELPQGKYELFVRGYGLVDSARVSAELGKNVNLTAVLETMRSAVAHMKPRRSGRIVVTASIAGIRAETICGYPYVATKAAVINIVRQAAVELAPHNVLVNAIAPGVFLTNIAGGKLKTDAAVREEFLGLIPMGRIAEANEIQGLALFLASPASSYLTGQVIAIDGGITAA